MDGNWGDHVAALERDPFPKLRLAVYFDKKIMQGPWGTRSLKPKEFKALLQTHNDAWTVERALRLYAGVAVETAQSLHAMKSSKRKDHVAESMLKAQEHMKRKQTQRIVAFGS